MSALQNESNQQMVVFSYASPFHESVKLSERMFTLCDQVLRLQQRYKPDTKGGTSIGQSISMLLSMNSLVDFLQLCE